VWYDPIQSIGGTAWPVTGFIYNERIDGGKAAKPAVKLDAPAFADTKRRDVIGEIIAASSRKK
jgi:hypothetical protein